MNLNPFHYSQTSENIMYHYYNSTESAHKFYLNGDLVGEHKKLLGKYSTIKDNVRFELEAKLSKSIIKFIVDGEELEVIKVSKKQIREFLKSRDIYNEINPSLEEIEKNRFKLKELTAPLVLIILAIGIQYFTIKPLFYKIIPAIPCLFAGLMLHSTLVNHVKVLEPIRKLGFAVAILVYALVDVIANQLYN